MQKIDFYSLCELGKFLTLLSLSFLTWKIQIKSTYLIRWFLWDFPDKTNSQHLTSSITLSKYYVLLGPFCRCRHWDLDWLSGVAKVTWVESRKDRTQAQVCSTTMLLLLITGCPAQTEKFLRMFCLIWTIGRAWVLVSSCPLRDERVELRGSWASRPRRDRAVGDLCFQAMLGFVGKLPTGATVRVCVLHLDLLHSCNLRRECRKGLGFLCHLMEIPAVLFQVEKAGRIAFSLCLSLSVLTLILSKFSWEHKWSVAWRLRCHDRGAMDHN